ILIRPSNSEGIGGRGFLAPRACSRHSRNVLAVEWPDGLDVPLVGSGWRLVVVPDSGQPSRESLLPFPAITWGCSPFPAGVGWFGPSTALTSCGGYNPDSVYCRSNLFGVAILSARPLATRFRPFTQRFDKAGRSDRDRERRQSKYTIFRRPPRLATQ